MLKIVCNILKNNVKKLHAYVMSIDNVEDRIIHVTPLISKNNVEELYMQWLRDRYSLLS